MQGALLSLLLLTPTEVASEAMRAAVVARYGRPDRFFSPGPSATLMPTFVYVRDSGLDLPVPPWQTDAAYAEAFEIARQGFHAVQPDRARALMVFTSFEEGGNNLFYVPLANDVRGLGETTAAQIFDDSPDHSLDGYIWMGSLERLEEAGEAYFREAFLHEIAHRWTAYAAIDHPVLPRRALRGRQSTHWSFLVDREQSPMDGNDWVHDGADLVTAISDPPFFAFSPLDLYFMGVMQPSDVPPFEVVVGFGNVSPSWVVVTEETAPAHRLGVPVTLSNATVEVVTIDDVIAGSGEREPPAIDRAYVWPIAVVFLSNGFSTPTLADFELLDRRVRELAARFEEATGGRVILDLTIEGAGALPPGATCEVIDDCDRTLSDACEAPATGEDRICTRTCQTGAVCGPGQCCAEGICAPSRACGTVMRPGEEDGGTPMIVPPPPPGSLVLGDERGCNCSGTSELPGAGMWIVLALSRAIQVIRVRRRRPPR